MRNIRLTSPVEGELIPLSEVKDAVFASGAMGRGAAETTGPAAAKVQQRAAAEHAYDDLPDEQRVADAWKAAMADVLKVKDQNQIPELNVYQCGTYTMHSLEEAQDIARHIIERDVRINSNDELALPKEKLQELHI